jgi:alpha-tubulin suppressor-like RCC1 family protein
MTRIRSVIAGAAAAVLVTTDAAAAIRVAVITTPDNDGAGVVAQLNDSTRFEFAATAVPAATAAQSGVLAEYDVILTGWTNIYTEFTAGLLREMADLVDSGKGFVGTSWLGNVLSASGASPEIAETLSPVQLNTQYTTQGEPIVVQGGQDVAEGIESFALESAYGEYAVALNPGSTVIASYGDPTHYAAVIGSHGGGHNVYLGAFYSAGDSYEASGLRDGASDRLLEQAVAWAADSRTRHNCIETGGALKCWGANKWGQLGSPALASVGDDPNEVQTLAPVDLGAGFRVRSVALGSEFTCALSEAGAVKCFGRNDAGQLGVGDVRARGLAPGDMGDALPAVALGEPATQVAAGESHACALLASGAVKCWGLNKSGQLGLGNRDVVGDGDGEVPLPVDLGSMPRVVQIVAGARHSCALFADGALKCWGENGSGQLGLGTQTARGVAPGEMGDALPPVDLGPGFTASSLAAMASGSCALDPDQGVKCWGADGSGELGHEDAVSRGGTPEQMGAALPLVDLGIGQAIDGLTCGDHHCCATFLQHTLKCWGSNRSGQLGLGDALGRGRDAGTMGDDLPFVSFQTFERVLEARARGDGTCARTARGWLCWGGNSDGLLGAGDMAARGATPQTVPSHLTPLAI